MYVQLKSRQTWGQCWAGVGAGWPLAVFWIEQLRHFQDINILSPQIARPQWPLCGALKALMGRLHSQKDPKILSVAHLKQAKLAQIKNELHVGSPRIHRGKHWLSKVNIYCAWGRYFNRPGTAGPWLDLCHSLEPVSMLFSSWESIQNSEEKCVIARSEYFFWYLPFALSISIQKFCM